MRTRQILNTLFLIGALLLLINPLRAQDSVKVGDRPPDFTLPAATKDSIIARGVHLADRIGRNNIVIGFFPAAWSGGCTKEFCTMRDNFGSLSDLGADVLAISGDYVFSLHQWAMEQHFQFTLLSDHNHAVAKRYQSYNPQSGFNRRTIYLVDREGKVAYIDRAYDPNSLASFNKLKAELQRLKK
jgi:glutaredoxin-dependent peroxiredoxin